MSELFILSSNNLVKLRDTGFFLACYNPIYPWAPLFPLIFLDVIPEHLQISMITTINDRISMKKVEERNKQSMGNVRQAEKSALIYEFL